MFILARGDAVVQTTAPTTITAPANSELVVGVAVSVVALVITALAIISVVICIACVYYKKRVRSMEIELKEVQMVLPNPSYGQINPATQPNDCIVGTDDGQYETVKDYKVVV